MYPKLTEQNLDDFAKQYRHSAEEQTDLQDAYVKHRGNMDAVFDSVPLSNPIEDEERFRQAIETWIASNEVKAFKAFENEAPAKRKQRRRTAEREAAEAEQVQQERSKKAKKASSGDLYAIIARRNAKRTTGFEDFAAKYGVTVGQEDEPSEAEFQAVQARLDREASGERQPKTKKGKKKHK
jgi:DnaJ family protein C protein 9